MMKIGKKWALFALAACMAFPALLCGNASAVGDTASPAATITLTAPKLMANDCDLVYRFRVVGDEDGYLRLGTSVTDKSSEKKDTNDYTVIVTPGMWESGAARPYAWARSALDYNGTTYLSATQGFAANVACNNTVTNGVNSDKLSSTATTFELDSSVKKVLFACVYAGKVVEVTTTSASFDFSTEINGVTFTVVGTGSAISVKTNKTIECKKYSGQDSTYGAFAYHAFYS